MRVEAVTRQEMSALDEVRIMMIALAERAERTEDKMDQTHERLVRGDLRFDALEKKVDSMLPSVEMIERTVTAVTIGKRVLWSIGGAAVSVALFWDWLAVHFAWMPALGRGAGKG